MENIQNEFEKYLTESEKLLFTNSLVTKKIEADSLIISPGEDNIGALKVIGGSLRAYVSSENGREITFAKLDKNGPYYLHPGVFPDIDIFDITLVAETDCEIVYLPSVALSNILKSNKEIKILAYEHMLKTFAKIIKQSEERTFIKLEDRIIKLLIDKMDLSKSKQVSITQEEIAREINSVRVVVTRALNKMKRKALISLRRGKIIINNETALREQIKYL